MGSDGKQGGTPPGVREEVRSSILTALRRDFELRGGPTARRLAAAGVTGVLGAVGATLLISGHPFGHHPPWHVVVFTALWAGLLVVSVSLVLLRIRTPTLSVGEAALVGLLGLGLAGMCGTLCPDQHFLVWWSSTRAGAWLVERGGLALGALCFGFASSLVFAFAASALALKEPGSRGSGSRILPAAMLVLLLSPGIALQSVGISLAVFLSWLAASGAGAYLGVAAGGSTRGFLEAFRVRSLP